MLHFLQTLLDASTLSPHGYCLTWRPELIWVHVVSDAIIAIAYFSIPFALAIFVSKRSDVEFGWVFWAFAAFILACGATHVFSIWTLWIPDYGIEGAVKAITAIASIVTAIMLWPLLPKLLALPNPTQLREAYVALQIQTEERLRAEEMLGHSQRIDAIGQLTGGVAHDFNNILTVITGTIEILAEGVAKDPKLTATVKLIDEAATRGAEMTQRLLAFARKQPLQPYSTDVNTLLVDATKLLRQTLGEQIEIESILQDELPPVLVDASQLTTALLNLALNARDAMPYGGKLMLETRDVHLDEAYARVNRDVRPGQYVMVAVSDTGRGIPPAIRDKVFDPFFTTKPPGQGTGLGLSMVYGFVKQSEGHIKIYSEEGQGTSIKIYLPQARETDKVLEIAPAAPIEGGRETVLVVEDDALVRNFVTGQLKSLGYTTLVAGNAAEALKLIDQGAPLDLLFTDVIMPGTMNGRQLAEEVVKRLPTVKVLFTSGYTQNAIFHHGRLDPDIILLPKPYRKSDLARMVRLAISAPLTPSLKRLLDGS
jgi:signal transduction histidine kinase